jgi:hypothetical protein
MNNYSSFHQPMKEYFSQPSPEESQAEKKEHSGFSQEIIDEVFLNWDFNEGEDARIHAQKELLRQAAVLKGYLQEGFECTENEWGGFSIINPNDHNRGRLEVGFEDIDVGRTSGDVSLLIGFREPYEPVDSTLKRINIEERFDLQASPDAILKRKEKEKERLRQWEEEDAERDRLWNKHLSEALPFLNAHKNEDGAIFDITGDQLGSSASFLRESLGWKIEPTDTIFGHVEKRGGENVYRLTLRTADGEKIKNAAEFSVSE